MINEHKQHTDMYVCTPPHNRINLNNININLANVCERNDIVYNIWHPS